MSLRNPERLPGRAGRRAACALPVALLLAVLILGAGGCTKDKTDPTYPEPPPADVHFWLFGLWGSGPDDVYAVGQPGVIAHFNGTAWSFEASGTDVALTDVYSPDGGATYLACGHRGVILRKSGGGGWTRMESGTSADLYGLGSYNGVVHVAGLRGVLRRLSGSSWQDTGTRVIVRDANGGPVDTLDRRVDIDNLVVVTDRGIGGKVGTVLMADTVWDWQLRRLRGGRENIHSGIGNSTYVEGNFLATNAGRLFQLQLKDAGLAWQEIYSPSVEAVTGVWATGTMDLTQCFVATLAGEVVQETVQIIPGEVLPRVSVAQLLDVDIEFQDLWGAAEDDLFVCGKSETIMRFHDPGGTGTPSWQSYELNPPGKLLTRRTGPLVEKFGDDH